MINSSIMARSKQTTRYITQGGMVGWGGGAGGDSGAGHPSHQPAPSYRRCRQWG